MSDPKVTITLGTKGIDVKLENWTGVGAAMMERMYFAFVKAAQGHRATSLQKLNAEEAARQKAAKAAILIQPTKEKQNVAA